MPARVANRGKSKLPSDGRKRVVIEAVHPEIDAGRFPIKRTVQERVTVEASVFADGHDEVAAALLFRPVSQTHWCEVQMKALGNDRYQGSFEIDRLEDYVYTLRGWIDGFGTWVHDLAKRLEAKQDVSVDLEIGAALIDDAASRAPDKHAAKLRQFAQRVRSGGRTAARTALSAELFTLVSVYPKLSGATTYDRELSVTVDRERARFGAWYELFPRSTALEPSRHGTFADVEARLPYIASLGFDVLYLPPIHPIGFTNRKGRNNSTTAAASDSGSPWGIGSHEGGHTAIHPELGTLDDFKHLLVRAREHGLEIALDMAFQCSPDHPYVREHPNWFRGRPDGTIQYAENPPKKYQDIYPFDFESEDWRGLWMELRNVFLYWSRQGVRIFRVDNPHTKAFSFWEWVIGDVKREYPETIFLSEAFTRPSVMYRLAKLGFTQSYTYFAWRTGRYELMEYLTELTQTDVAEYFRPNLWPNTPDILTEQLQTGGRAAFASRLVLAATLGASYGIYGPAFELQEHLPLELGREEYLDSEKYEIRRWDLEDPSSLAPLIGQVNRIRRDHPALQTNQGLTFHETDNTQFLAYSKSVGQDVLLTVVNLDQRYRQSGWLDLDLTALGLEPGASFRVTDLLSAESYSWQGSRNYVELDPLKSPAHILHVLPLAE
ncbi:MAG TPA: alpha-1,4-glucan--maltose-1-phosphate maltosyltransferase [Chloroflexota bacterium]|nr:alpha-1,4-glucan--maltose-1-phosphate maltosyltransferase [Chloroflexota bacterium]